MTVLINKSLFVKEVAKRQSKWMGMRIIRSSPYADDSCCKKKESPGIVFSDVTAAAFRIRDRVRYTPVSKSHLSNFCDMDIYQKVEILHHTGSFKERGVVNKLTLLPMKVKEHGIVTATLGNFGLAVSYHCLRQGIPVTLVMPITTPMTKVHKCEAYKAKVILCGEQMTEVQMRAAEVAESQNITLLDSFDDYQLIAGYGSMALEMLDQVPDLDAILVPVGSGTLLAGIVTAITNAKPEVKIYGVETESCNSLSQSMEKGIAVEVSCKPTLADGLSVSSVGQKAFSCIEGKLHRVVTVSENWIARAILQLAELQKLVIEGAGAVGAAAIMAGLVPELKKKKVMIILSGGNMDITLLSRVLDRGMAEENRLVKFKVTTSDHIGCLATLAELIAANGVTVREFTQQRSYTNKDDIFSRRIKMVCETRNEKHTNELEKIIRQRYKEVIFGSQSGKKRKPCPVHGSYRDDGV